MGVVSFSLCVVKYFRVELRKRFLSLSLRASSRSVSSSITVYRIKVRVLIHIVIIYHNTQHYLCGIILIIIVIIIASTLIIIIIVLLFTPGETHGAEFGHQAAVVVFFPFAGDVDISQHFHDLLEFWASVHVGLPRVLDGVREDRVATLRDGGTHASLNDADGCLERSVSRIRYITTGDEFPERNCKRVDVALVVIHLVRDNFWRHPSVGPSFRRHHSVFCHDSRDAKVGNFHHVVFIHQQVSRFHVSVNDVDLVKIIQT